MFAAALAACAGKQAPEPLAEHRAARGSSTPMTARLELVEGTPGALPDGTVVNVSGVLYAHLADSRNLSRCELELARAGQLVKIDLYREHGEGSPPAHPVEALGWQLTLDLADPYQQPSRAIVNATKL